MKNERSMLKALMVSLMFSVMLPLSGQVDVKSAFEQENASKFESLFHTHVEMIVLNKDDRYAKSQAIELMDAFFKVHEVKRFEKMHSGQSRSNGSNYDIAQLYTDKGKYRVYIYYRQVDKKNVIHQLTIEED